MKTKNFLLLVAAVVVLFNFSSCKKYPDGPSFSLRSKTDRLTGTWKIVDGDNYNNDVDITFTFKKNGDFNL